MEASLGFKNSGIRDVSACRVAHLITVELLAAILLSGCLSIRDYQAPLGGPYQIPDTGISVALPYGWIRESETRRGITIKKDGSVLQIGGYNIAEASEEERHGLFPGMPPEQAARAIMDWSAKQNYLPDLNIIDISRIPISGEPGFRVVYTYHGQYWPKKGEYCGMLKGEWLYFLILQTEVGHFARDAQDFEKVKDSFVVNR